MLYGEQHVHFVIRMVDLLVRYDLILVKNFDGVEALVVLAAYCAARAMRKGASVGYS